ncbi:hypothetical protein [Haloplanus natans]|uniref:hypothetical protein n=1 Tax=Haloplanus natans TaxID=376171 RepID=UPI000677F42F|nr:hypothetical protein [Haloplanus natans]
MPDASLDPAPLSLTCAVCGEEVDDAGYLPATEEDGAYRPHPDAAVCGPCGFNEVGMLGCAPELDEVADAGPEDALLYVTRVDEGFEVVSAKG